MPIFDCEIEYSYSPHLSQIYDGFYALSQKNIITVRVKKTIGDPQKPILKLKLRMYGHDKIVTVYYDMLDGFNWLKEGTEEENLLYFRDNIKADYYFKRSFKSNLTEYAPENCKVHALGLNYYVDSRHNFNTSKRESLKQLVKLFIPTRFQKSFLYASDYEFPPIRNRDSKILFLTRLWDPQEVNDHDLKHERNEINQYRIECIEACRKEFGGIFTGGLQESEYSMSFAKKYIAPIELTNKENYIKNIRAHDICIATTGLHDSIGWKFGEYVSNSRAIVSEPLKYQVAGEFSSGKNYYEFGNKTDLIERVCSLLDNKDTLDNMMRNNYLYYNSFLRPENLVLNSLLTISHDLINYIPSHER